MKPHDYVLGQPEYINYISNLPKIAKNIKQKLLIPFMKTKTQPMNEAKMETFEFRILCADKQQSCKSVKALMTDFKIRDASIREYYDHVGTKDFESPDLAMKRLRELEKKAGGKIKNIVLARIR